MNRGCAIYEDRPAECQAIECLWRFGNLADRMRPDRCGVMFELLKPEKTVLANVDVFRPDAWKRGTVHNLIKRMTKDGYSVWIVVGAQRHLLLPEGQTEERSLVQLKEAWRRKWRLPATQPTSPP